MIDDCSCVWKNITDLAPETIDRLTRHHDTATGTEPGNASLARPRGTALSTT
jgi:hypothetical protein